MKTERRHDLQTNQLADWLGKELIWIKPYINLIVGGVIAAFLIMLFVSFRQGVDTEETERGWAIRADARNQGFQAIGQRSGLKFTDQTERLQDLAREYAGTDLEIFANLDLGDLYANRGASLMSTNRSDANQNIEDSINRFATILRLPSVPESLQNRVRFSLAKSYEWASNSKDAITNYSMVEGVYKPRAQARIEALKTDASAAFYSEFASFVPAPPTAPGSVTRPNSQFSNPNTLIGPGDSTPDSSTKSPESGSTEPPVSTEAPTGETSTEQPASPEAEKPDAEKTDAE